MPQTRVLRGVFTGTVVLLLAFSAQARKAPAAAGEPTKQIETESFSLRVPSHYTLLKVRSSDGRGLWALNGREGKIYLGLQEAQRGRLDSLLASFIKRELADRLRFAKLERTRVRRMRGGEMAMTFGHAFTPRQRRGWIYKFGFVAVRKQGEPRVVYVAFGGSRRGWSRQVRRIRLVLRSLQLKAKGGRR